VAGIAKRLSEKCLIADIRLRLAAIGIRILEDTDQE
jgi:hypothetical protein